MVIPAFDGDAWHLPEGVHVTSLDEIEQRFVEEAPFAEDRRRVFDALTLWTGLVRDLVPEARFWVDGGFVTRKPWAPPSDVDVTVFAKPDALNSLDPEAQARFEQLLSLSKTHKPMGGLVDAYLVTRGDVPWTLYWRELWSTALDENRQPVPNVKKGYLEVRP